MLAINPETIHDELTSAKKIIDKWLTRLDAGLPLVDKPGGEEELEMLMREFCGELKVCALKTGGLAEVLSGD